MADPSAEDLCGQLAQRIADGAQAEAVGVLREAVFLVSASRIPVTGATAYEFLRHACDLSVWTEAEFWARRVMSDPPDSDTWVVSASLLLAAFSRRGDFGAALAAVDTMPEPPAGASSYGYFQLYLNQSQIMLAVQRWPEALDLLDLAERYLDESSSADSWQAVALNRGTSLSALGREREALESYDRALTRGASGPGAERLLLNRANALRDLKDYRAAQEAYDAAFAAAGDDLALRGQILSNLGNLMLATDRRDEGVKLLRQAVEMRGQAGDKVGQAVSLGLLSSTHTAEGDFHAALALEEQAYSLLRAAGVPTRTTEEQIGRLREAIAAVEASPSLAGKFLADHLLSSSSYSERIDELNRASLDVLEYAMASIAAESVSGPPDFAEAKRRDAHQFLGRVHEVGAQLALAEYEGKQQKLETLTQAVHTFGVFDSWLERKRFYALNQRLFEEFFVGSVPVVKPGTGLDDLQGTIQTLIGLTAAVRRDGLDLAFARIPEATPGELVERLVSVGTWPESRGLIEAHLETYLSAETLRFIDETIPRVGFLAKKDLETHAELLRRCAAVGVDAAFAEVWDGTNVHQQKIRIGSVEISDETAEGIPEELANFDVVRQLFKRGGQPVESAKFGVRLGQQLLKIATDRPSMLKALEVLHEARDDSSPGWEVDTYYSCSISIGDVHLALYNVDGRPEDLVEAALNYRSVLDLTETKSMPRRTGQAASGLFVALSRLRAEHADQWNGDEHQDLVETLLQSCRRERELIDEELRSGRIEDPLWWPFTESVLIEHDRQRHGAALLAAEGGRGRQFLTEVGGQGPLPGYVSAELAARETAARKRLKELYASDLASSQEHEWAISGAQSALRGVLDELAADHPDLARVRSGAALTPSDLNEFVDGLSPDAVVLAWYSTPTKCVSFLLRGGTREILSADAALSWTDLQSYVDLAAGDLWRRPASPDQRPAAGWTRLMDALVPPAWAPHLERARELILLPHGLLHELPLHALALTAASGRTLTDLGTIRHLPGLAFAGPLRKHRSGRGSAGAAGAVGATGTVGTGGAASVFAFSGGTDPHFSAEATTVAAVLGTRPFLGGEATCERLVAAAPGSRLLHVAAHGRFDPADPLGSGIRLADGVLSARDVVDRLRLDRTTVVLSGCETSRRGLSPLDESEGLVRAFFVAGADAVVASQWTVDSASTRDLMEDVYARSQRQGMAAALRESMLELRKRLPHPYYWAPFILWGGEPGYE